MREKKDIPKASLKSRLVFLLMGLCSGFLLQFLPIDGEFDVLNSFTNSAATSVELSTSAATDQETVGLPTHGIYLKKQNYLLNYDPHTKNPAWVYHKLQAKDFEGKADRENCEFEEDATIPAHLRAHKKDYSHSGFDRGHLVSASSSSSSPEAMQESFLLSNVVPQLPSFNRGYWKKLENELRQLAHEHDLHVFVGPLYLPTMKNKDRLFVKYQVLGQSHIAVPTHFFAVIFTQLKKQKVGVKAYILPHKVIDATTPLDKFVTTLHKVEEASGIVFDNFIRSLQ